MKSVKALSSKSPPPFTGLGGGTTPLPPPLYAVVLQVEIKWILDVNSEDL